MGKRQPTGQMKTAEASVPPQKKLITRRDRLEDVYQRMMQEDVFSVLKYRKNFVRGYGQLYSPACVFIGEAPGEQEDRAKVPFIGPAGGVLGELLHSIDLKRDHVFTTNTIKWQPPRNRDPEPHEMEVAWPYLLEEIELLEANIIVPLGRFAFHCFFPTLSITQSRGIVMAWRHPVSRRRYRVLPMFHPAVALYTPGNKAVMFDDFKVLGEMIP